MISPVQCCQLAWPTAKKKRKKKSGKNLKHYFFGKVLESLLIAWQFILLLEKFCTCRVGNPASMCAKMDPPAMALKQALWAAEEKRKVGGERERERERPGRKIAKKKYISLKWQRRRSQSGFFFLFLLSVLLSSWGKSGRATWMLRGEGERDSL